jgi:hypothetical protein
MMSLCVLFECKLSGILIKYILVWHNMFIWYAKIYLISIHDNLHSTSTQRHNMFYMVECKLSCRLIKYILVYQIKHVVSMCAVWM